MTTYTQDNDKLYRFLLQNRAGRGAWVRLNDAFTETLSTHHYP
ncbi:redox-regulated molecular chaperone Hsp33, partial [Glaesserella parasuis]|nr:redox-regulated molecular chaperone Hsp33 [Glaesserella parasuis]